MHAEDEPHNLDSLLEHMQHAPDDSDQVTLGQMLEAVGHRSFGAMLLVPGLLLLTPISGLPFMASTMGFLAALVAGQLLLRRRSFWLPQWLTRIHVPKKRYCQALAKLRPIGRFIDRFIRPRLVRFVRAPVLQIIAGFCTLTGLLMPALEFVPFADTAPGVAMTIFGLALIAQDGLLAAIAGVIYLASFGLVLVALL